MLTFPELVEHLDRRHITATCVAGKLRLEGNRAAFTPEIRQAVEHWKERLAWLVWIDTEHAFAACDRCGEFTVTATKNRTGPKCRMTPGCPGRHVERLESPTRRTP